MKKIGTKLSLVIAIIISTLIILVLTISYFSFYKIQQTTLLNQCTTAINILDDSLQKEYDEIDVLADNLYTDFSLKSGLSNKDPLAIEKIFSNYGNSEEIFSIFIDTKGMVVWESNNAPTSFDLSDALNGTTTKDLYANENVNLSYIIKTPITHNKEIIGAVLVGQYFTDTDIVDTVKGQTETDVTIFQSDIRINTTIENTDGSRAIGTQLDYKISDILLNKGLDYTGDAVILNTKMKTIYKPLKNNSGEILGIVFAGQPTKTIIAEFNKAIIYLIIISVTFTVLAIFIFVFVIKKMITKPLKQVVKAAEQIQNGNFDINIEKKSNDEIGALIDSFNLMASNLNAIIEDTNYILCEMGNKNFVINSQCKEKYVGNFAQIVSSVSEIKSNLTKAMLEIDEGTAQFNLSSGQISGGAQTLSQGATEQAAAIEELTGTIDSIGNKIQNTATLAKEVENVFTDTMKDIDGGQNQMAKMVVAMDDISDKSKEIENIIKTIDDISFQTNILALNAAVEAARAGNAGKGFSIVADEVRNLAQKSANAAKSTTNLIKGTIESVNTGSQIASSTSETFNEIVQKTNKINTNIKSIVTANVEQAESIDQVITGVSQISGVVQTNSATAEESAASCEELASQAEVLKNLVGTFKLK